MRIKIITRFKGYNMKNIMNRKLDNFIKQQEQDRFKMWIAI